MPKFHALLIGINFYYPHVLADGNRYKSLQGCIRDIDHVEAFLKSTFNLEPDQITKLTASESSDPNLPAEPPELLPTYENMVTKFQEITAKLQKGDRLYIHYSGHGGRAQTIYPDLKGINTLDSNLVPTDIGLPNGRYLRDLELAQLLKQMVDKGLLVTVVLDCCNSGGSTRGENSDVRGADFIDKTPRATESLVASTADFAQIWEDNQSQSRNVSPVTYRLPIPKGYTLLAACRDNEFAMESVFEGNERNGALTYWLLDTLRKSGSDIPAQVLHNRLLAKIHSQFTKQTPMLIGETNRTLFTDEIVSVQKNIPVIKIDLAKKRVQLEAGQSNGILKGTEFAIYKFGTTDFTKQEAKVALAKVVELGSSHCWAEVTTLFGVRSPIVEVLPDGIIAQGAPAVILGPGVQLVRKVRLFIPEQPVPQIDAKVALENLKKVKAHVQGNGWLEFVSETDQNQDINYLVTINPQGEYIILDAGGEEIEHISPSLPVTQEQAAETLINRLVHLAKYQAALQLDNDDLASPLNGKLKLELGRSIDRQFEPIIAPDNIVTFADGEQVFMRIRNESNRILNVTALAIQSDWSIAQLYPSGADFEVLDPQQEIFVDFNASLPSGYQLASDTIKVFATIEATSFLWLELPALDQERKGVGNKKPANGLEDFLSAFAKENAPTRNVTAVAYPSKEWTTEQIRLTVTRS